MSPGHLTVSCRPNSPPHRGQRGWNVVTLVIGAGWRQSGSAAARGEGGQAEKY